MPTVAERWTDAGGDATDTTDADAEGVRTYYASP
jgi:hypothetical protein